MNTAALHPLGLPHGRIVSGQYIRQGASYEYSGPRSGRTIVRPLGSTGFSWTWARGRVFDENVDGLTSKMQTERRCEPCY